MQLILSALLLAVARAGKSVAAKNALFAMATCSSIKVKAIELPRHRALLNNNFCMILSSSNTSFFHLLQKPTRVASPPAKTRSPGLDDSSAHP
jgi:hypothetical protein